MESTLACFRKTVPHKHVLLPRLVAGLPLLVLGARHYVDPGHFRNILVASGLPMVDLSAALAPAAEVLAGILLLTGTLARLGGLLGIATMVPAIVSTLAIKGLDPQNLPGGLTEVPFVPPLPVPVVVLLCSAYVLWRGAGAWSVDAAQAARADTSCCSQAPVTQ